MIQIPEFYSIQLFQVLARIPSRIGGALLQIACLIHSCNCCIPRVRLVWTLRPLIRSRTFNNNLEPNPERLHLSIRC